MQFGEGAAPAQPVHDVIQAGIDLLLYLLVCNHQRVQPGLGEEQFGRDHILQYLAAGVAVHNHTAGLHHPNLLLYVGEQHHVVTDHRHRLVYQATAVCLGLQRNRCCKQKHRDRQY